jgi:hypothetical protein
MSRCTCDREVPRRTPVCAALMTVERTYGTQRVFTRLCCVRELYGYAPQLSMLTGGCKVIVELLQRAHRCPQHRGAYVRDADRLHCRMLERTASLQNL